MTLSLWQWILLACALAFVTKLLGYSLPERWMRSPRMAQIAACLTVALLASHSAWALLPIARIAAPEGPMKTRPAASTASAKSSFSARKP